MGKKKAPKFYKGAALTEADVRALRVGDWVWIYYAKDDNQSNERFNEPCQVEELHPEDRKPHFMADNEEWPYDGDTSRGYSYYFRAIAEGAPHIIVPKLQTCPFCGLPPRMAFSQDETLMAGHNIVWHARVCCDNGCSDMSEEDPSQQEAAYLIAERWNTRFVAKPKKPRAVPAWKREGFSSKAVWDKHHRALEGMD